MSARCADGTTEALAHRHSVELCQRLLDEGVEDLHFYTLNKPHLTEAVCRALGLTRLWGSPVIVRMEPRG